MMRRIALWALPLMFAIPSSSFAQPQATPKTAAVSMVASTSIDQALPFDAVNGKGWRPEAGTQYVKLHLYFDAPISLGKIEVDSCAGPFKSPVLTYINFDEDSYEIQPQGDKLIQKTRVMTARSVTFNFQKNEPVCVSQVKLYDGQDNPYALLTPKVVEGSVTASSTSKPMLSYDVMNLFDSRYEYAWSSDQKADGESLKFQFNEPQHIEKIKIWNGYQRSDVHCFSNARPKTLVITGDNGYSAEVPVKDIMGSQDLILPKPFDGKSLTLTVKDSYAGKKYKDLVISELRFYSGKEWFLVNPLQAIHSISAENRKQFQGAGLSDVLNKSLVMEQSTNAGSKRWLFRLRSDGSMYVEGNQETAGKYQDFYALGNYEVKEATPTGLKLRLFGFLRKFQGFGGDCNGCGRDCNQAKAEDGSEQKIFEDFITLSKSGNQYVVQNVGTAKKLNFTKLTLKLDATDLR
ncbi:MAG: discoidin domain-containing protein [bacterium]